MTPAAGSARVASRAAPVAARGQDSRSRAREAEGGAPYLLRLFIAGFTARSQRAIENLTRICEEHLPGRYQIEVVDLGQTPALARDHQIIATPTLVKVRPAPQQRVIGDLSQVDKVLRGLDIP